MRDFDTFKQALLRRLPREGWEREHIEPVRETADWFVGEVWTLRSQRPALGPRAYVTFYLLSPEPFSEVLAWVDDAPHEHPGHGHLNEICLGALGDGAVECVL